MKRSFLTAVLIVIVIIPALASAERPNAAVLDLRGGDGVDAKTVETFSSIIRNEAQQLEKYKVVNKLPINFNDILMALGCTEATDTCLIQAAEQVNAKVLIFGTLDQTNDGLKVVVTIFDAGNKRTLNKLTRTIASTDDPVITFRREVANFFAASSDAAVTRLQIGSNVTGAKIEMEDTFVGTTPYERKGLPPGTYKIVVSSDSHDPHQANVTLTEGEDVSIWAELKPVVSVSNNTNGEEKKTFEQSNANLKRTTDPSGKTLNWPALAIAGGGVALIGASLIVGGMVKGTENEISDLRDRGELTRSQFDELKRRGESQQLIHFILLGSGIGIATGGIVWFALSPVERDRVSIHVSPTRVNATFRF